jgi:hypothetical protein
MKQNNRQLYKVTKITLRKPFDYRTNTVTSDKYEVVKTRVDYRTSKGAVTLAFKHAQSVNEHADRMERTVPNSNPYRADVEVEVCDLPDFKPACFCPEHGVQPMFNVPGLTTELTCVECI